MTLGQLIEMIRRYELQEEIVQEMEDRKEEYFPHQLRVAKEILASLHNEEIDL